TAILTEASLSYLGLGVPPPHASWGRELSGSAQSFALVAPWLMIFPGIAIMLVVLAFNVFGDSLRDVWDPRLRGS
ncbi:MAG: ABC transporter permease, partial [Dehalococcoidia bacterium]|nr:ABC transporter permease [Dehalococcoidia bacterium]